MPVCYGGRVGMRLATNAALVLSEKRYVRSPSGAFRRVLHKIWYDPLVGPSMMTLWYSLRGPSMKILSRFCECFVSADILLNAVWNLLPRYFLIQGIEDVPWLSGAVPSSRHGWWTNDAYGVLVDWCRSSLIPAVHLSTSVSDQLSVTLRSSWPFCAWGLWDSPVSVASCAGGGAPCAWTICRGRLTVPKCGMGQRIWLHGAEVWCA